MPLFEVDQKYLKYQSEKELYRFISDPKNRISIHIWQDKKELVNGPDKGISRFQVAMDADIIEWKNEHLSYGQVDLGDDVFGIKKSPIMMMTQNINSEFIKIIIPILKDNLNIAGINFIIRVLEEGL